MKHVIASCAVLWGLPFGHKSYSKDIHGKDHIEFSLFGSHARDGSWGVELVDELQSLVPPSADDFLIKGLDQSIISHSVSTSPTWPAHVAQLRNKNIRRVFVGGLAFTHCVGDSAISYAKQQFQVFVVLDATKSVAPPYGNPEWMRNVLALYDIQLVTLDELLPAKQ